MQGTDLYLDAAGVDLYDCVFGWRRDRELDFVEKCLDVYGHGRRGAVLDVACGAGRFLAEARARGWRVAGVDSSQRMIDLARARLRSDAQLIVASMADFAVTGRFDVATCWLDSMPYLHTNEEIISHFHCVASALKDGGLYLVDLGFSRWAEPFWYESDPNWEPELVDGWSVRCDDTEVYHDGCDGPPCDPLRHLATEYLYFRTTRSDSDESSDYCYTALKRALHPQEFAALVSASMAFEIVKWFTGDFDLDCTFDAASAKGRGLVLLRKNRQ